MSLHWDHQFCLACDKQTDGQTYCSEPCRLADFETSTAPSTPSSAFSPPYMFLASSPTTKASDSTPQLQQELPLPQRRSTGPAPYGRQFGRWSTYLPPLASPQPTGPAQRTPWTALEERSYYAPSPAATRPHILSPSSSRTSLSSIRSTSSSPGSNTAMISEKAAKELREYARSFESVRSQRRRSQ